MSATGWVLFLGLALLSAVVAAPPTKKPTAAPSEAPTMAPTHSPSANLERAALKQVYDDLAKQKCDLSGFGWDFNKNPCEWPDSNIVCSGNDRVTELYFESLNCTASPTIPTSIGKFAVLSELTFLSLARARFHGTIPSELGRLTTLKSLYANENDLSEVPTKIGDLRQLELLDLTWNKFKGVPSFLSCLSELTSLSLAYNSISGQLPKLLFNLRNLEELRLGSNDFTGTIEGIQNLVNATHIDFTNNSLRGTIPSSLGNLPCLKNLFLQQNSLTGTIPASLFHLEKLSLRENALIGSIPELFSLYKKPSQLKILALGRNCLSGTIPRSIEFLSRLEIFDAVSSGLDGTLPEGMSKLSHLQYLNLGNNKFSGSISKTLFGNWGSIFYLDLSDNRFTSSLPETIGDMSAIAFFYLNDNSFTDCPSSISRLTGLKSLNLSTNFFSGYIGDIIGDLPSLEYIDLSSNKLIGEFPESLPASLKLFIIDSNDIKGTLPASLFTSAYRSLETFSVKSTSLSGPIPNVDGASLPSLSYFDLSSCAFVGPIPSSIGQLSSLQVLHLSFNKLTDSIPAQLCLLPQLSSLSLSNNNLNGEFHACLGNISTLQYIHIDNNHLSGPFYSQIGKLTALERLLLAGSSLTGSMPSQIGNLRSLTFFSLKGNFLSEGIPFELGRLKNMRNLDLSDNLFEYDERSGVGLSFLSNASMPHLEYLDIGKNAFKGPMPAQLFRILSLETIVMTGNCFTGSIPASICEATNVVNLLLDGLSVGETGYDLCSKPIWSKSWSSSFGFNARSTNKMLGSIPSCVFSLPKLVKLHLAGNQLSGKIDPSLASWPSDLSELILAHNRLTQPIPSHLQRQFSRLHRVDLSANKFNGTIYDLELPSIDIDVSVNRLSGQLPSSVLRPAWATKINILDGNAFSCNGGRDADLPRSDPSYSDFHCASDITDAMIYIFISFFVAFLVFYYLYETNPPSDCKIELLNGLEHVQMFLEKSDAMTRILAILACIYVFFLFPVYGASTAYYRSRTFLYIWTLSGAFKTGVSASYLLMFCFTTVILSAFSMLVVWHSFELSPMQDKIKQLFQFSNESTTGNLGLAKKVELAWIPKSELENEILTEKEEAERRLEMSAIQKLQRGVVPVLIARLVLVFSVSITVSMAVNIAYVRTIETLSSTQVLFMQVCMACFKSGWTFAATMFLKSKESYFGYEKRDVARVFKANVYVSALLSESYFTYVVLDIIIRIVIPCGASAFADSNCFKDYFYSVKPIQASYGSKIEYVSSANSTGISVDLSADKWNDTVAPYKQVSTFANHEMVGSSVSFLPPFQYRYLCSSRILEMYAPVVATSVVFRILHHFWVRIARWIIDRYFKKSNPTESVYRRLLMTLTALDRTRFERRSREAHHIADLRAAEDRQLGSGYKDYFHGEVGIVQRRLGIKEQAEADDVISNINRLSQNFASGKQDRVHARETFALQQDHPESLWKRFEKDHSDELDEIRRLFSHLDYSVALVFDFSLLLTFGLVSAPIGIVLMIAIAIKVNDIRRKIKRVATLRDENDLPVTSNIDRDVSSKISQIERERLEKEAIHEFEKEGTDLFRSRWLLVFVSTLFTSYYCFDAAGDSLGKARAVGFPALYIFFVFVLAFLIETIIRASPSTFQKSTRSTRSVSEAGGLELAYPSKPEFGGVVSNLQRASLKSLSQSMSQGGARISLSGASTVKSTKRDEGGASSHVPEISGLENPPA